MARPYTAAYHGAYQIDPSMVRTSCGLRPNKLAAGMQFTATRDAGKGGQLSRDALTLAVFGTLDPLARTNQMRAYRRRHYKQVTVIMWQRRVS